MSTKVSEFYENFHHERRKGGTIASPERIDFFAKEIGTDKDVVELGCRYGDLLAHFVKDNRVVGCDIDRNAVEICRKKLSIPTQVVSLNDALPYDAAQFDVVILSEVLEHLPYPALTLAEIARICRPNGKLVGSVPNGARLKNRLRFLAGGPVDVDRTHLHFFSAERLRVLLQSFFTQVIVLPVGGQYVGLSKNLFANLLLFSASGPSAAVVQ